MTDIDLGTKREVLLRLPGSRDPYRLLDLLVGASVDFSPLSKSPNQIHAIRNMLPWVPNSQTVGWRKMVESLFLSIENIQQQIEEGGPKIPAIEAVAPVLHVDNLRPGRTDFPVTEASKPIFEEGNYVPLDKDFMLSIGDAALRGAYISGVPKLSVMFQFE